MGRPSDGREQAEQTAADQAARHAQRAADELACRAWNLRMKQGGPRESSPSLRAALNGGYRFLRVQCRGCKQHAYVDLAQVKRPPATPVWSLQRDLACRHCGGGRRRGPRATVERLARERRYDAEG
jgi:hypothetical protein